MKVCELLSDESRWCQGVHAKDKDDFVVQPEHRDAFKFCVIGAIRKCYGPFNSPEFIRVSTLVGLELGLKKGSHFLGNIAIWNDSSSFETVIATLKKLDI